MSDGRNDGNREGITDELLDFVGVTEGTIEGWIDGLLEAVGSTDGRMDEIVLDTSVGKIEGACEGIAN